jgi:hypothetical protein
LNNQVLTFGGRAVKDLLVTTGMTHLLVGGEVLAVCSCSQGPSKAMLVSISAYTYLPQNALFPADSALEPIIGTTTDVRFCHLSQRLAHAVAWAWLVC